jgi:glycosyltransferase involved in cell wall biosynthesis
MNVMFIHPNFPAQFGQLAAYFSTQRGWPCTFVTSIDTTHLNLPFVHINYKVYPGPQPKNFTGAPTLQAHLDHMLAVYKGLRTAPQIKPDLVVGHTSFGTMLYLRNLYPCPFIGYYELLPLPFWTDGLVLRKEYPPTEDLRLFNAAYHAPTYLHLHAVDAAYTPTYFQRDSAPAELRSKIRVHFDGVDAELFQPRALGRPLDFHGRTIGPKTRVVTYVSRGLESIRGFDIFMEVAARLSREIDDIIFLVAGEERTCYGHELHHTGGQSFKQHVLSKGKYDLSKFHFLGRIPVNDLAILFNLSDLHIYLTVPFVLSWSLVQAMASGCRILGSDTAPVREVIRPGVHGLMADFYDVESLTNQALRVLRDPGEYRPLGEAARQRVLERYELRLCANELARFFEEVAGEKKGGPATTAPVAPPASGG